MEINYCRKFHTNNLCTGREPDCKQKLDDCKLGFKVDEDGVSAMKDS